MNSRVKNLLFWVVVGLFMILLFNLFSVPTHAPEDEVIFSDFMAKLDKGEVMKVTIKANHISAILKDQSRIRTYTAEYPELVKHLREKDVQIEARPPDESPWYITFLVTWGPFILFLGLWFFLMRQMQIGGNKALSFGKSRARMLTEERKKVTFSDVAGIEEAKEEVLEIIEFLKDPRKFQKLDHLRRRRRLRRGQGRSRRAGRIPARSVEVPETGRAHSERCPDCRSSGNWKDVIGEGHCRRGRRSVLQYQRIGLCGNVCRSRCFQSPRSLRAGEETCSLHHLHRRNRCGRSFAWRRSRWRPR